MGLIKKLVWAALIGAYSLRAISLNQCYRTVDNKS